MSEQPNLDPSRGPVIDSKDEGSIYNGLDEVPADNPTSLHPVRVSTYVFQTDGNLGEYQLVSSHHAHGSYRLSPVSV